MDEQRLAELLQLVDDPVDSPGSADFKQRLRLELDKTLYHAGAAQQPVQLVPVGSDDERRNVRRRSGALLAAAAAVAVLAIVGVMATRDRPEPAPADQPSSSTTTSTTTTVAILPEVGAACERYAERAEPLGVLAAFGRAHNAPMPDFIATERALRQLIVDGAEGGFVGADVLDSLELAAGALAEAHREATSGNPASASSSTQVAALNLSELRSSPLTGCFP